MKAYKFFLFCISFFFLSPKANAQWEAEVDPTAYALKGFSAHVGRPIFAGRLRFQVGAFGAETPEWIHGNSGFTEYSSGGTFKVDCFLLRRLSGLFVGVDSNYSRVRYEFGQTRERKYRDMVGLGPRVGYRFDVGNHFYVSPWFSVDRQFNAKDVSISGKIFHEKEYSLFPAVHLGWRF